MVMVDDGQTRVWESGVYVGGVTLIRDVFLCALELVGPEVILLFPPPLLLFNRSIQELISLG